MQLGRDVVVDHALDSADEFVPIDAAIVADDIQRRNAASTNDLKASIGTFTAVDAAHQAYAARKHALKTQLAVTEGVEQPEQTSLQDSHRPRPAQRADVLHRALSR